MLAHSLGTPVSVKFNNLQVMDTISMYIQVLNNYQMLNVNVVLFNMSYNFMFLLQCVYCYSVFTLQQASRPEKFARRASCPKIVARQASRPKRVARQASRPK